MTPGLYIAGRSPLHRLAPGPKCLGLAAAAALVLALRTPAAEAAAMLAALAVAALARLPLGAAARQAPAGLALVGLVGLAQGWAGDWAGAAAAALRFGALMVLGVVFAATTRVSDLMDMLERVLRPLGRFGVRPGRLALLAAMTLRFVPMLFEEARSVREAQAARGLGRHPVATLVPFSIGCLRAADAMAEALAARGYDPEDAD